MTHSRYAFEQWPLDLLTDYVLKIHHRGIRREGPVTLELIAKMCAEHPEDNPALDEISALFTELLNALENDLQKEENVLFPYFYEFFDAVAHRRPIEPFHCGTVQAPIQMMMMEHDDELLRQNRIQVLTNDFSADTDTSDNYKTLVSRLHDFYEALLEHTYIENEIIFPGFIRLEAENLI